MAYIATRKGPLQGARRQVLNFRLNRAVFSSLFATKRKKPEYFFILRSQGVGKSQGVKTLDNGAKPHAAHTHAGAGLACIETKRWEFSCRDPKFYVWHCHLHPFLMALPIRDPKFCVSTRGRQQAGGLLFLPDKRKSLSRTRIYTAAVSPGQADGTAGRSGLRHETKKPRRAPKALETLTRFSTHAPRRSLFYLFTLLPFYLSTTLQAALSITRWPFSVERNAPLAPAGSPLTV